MSNPQPICCLKVDVQKVEKQTGGKWLIHDRKRRKDNQLQRWNSPKNVFEKDKARTYTNVKMHAN